MKPSAISTISAEDEGDPLREIRGLRVLIVDDDEDTRDILEMILTDAGAVVASADSVHRAFELLVSTRPQIIISDIEMPFENGHSFLRNLRSVLDEDGGQTPAIALTGCTSPEDRARVLASGFNLHIAKPTTSGAVLRALADIARTLG